jgi:hypothetical protein
MTLAAQIHRELERGERYVIYEFELSHIWPLNEKDREAKVTQFAQEHGLRLRFYREGWCAVFDKAPLKSARTFTKSAPSHDRARIVFNCRMRKQSAIL